MKRSRSSPKTLAHYQGDAFAALASPDTTNEEAYALQLFTRAVMGSNNVDRHLSARRSAPSGDAVAGVLGADVTNTNNMQEILHRCRGRLWSSARTSARPRRSPRTGSITRRSTAKPKYVVISQDDYPARLAVATLAEARIRARPRSSSTASLARSSTWALDLTSDGGADLRSLASHRSTTMILSRSLPLTGVPARRHPHSRDHLRDRRRGAERLAQTAASRRR